MKSNKIAIIVAILLAITNGVILYVYFNWGQSSDNSKEYSKIDSLKGKNDSLKEVNKVLLLKIDSLEREISNIDSVVTDINDEYEEVRDNIITQPVTDDILFFTTYLSKTDSGFFNFNNSDSVKTDKFNISGTPETKTGKNPVKQENRFTKRNNIDTTRVDTIKGSAIRKPARD